MIRTTLLATIRITRLQDFIILFSNVLDCFLITPFAEINL